MKKLFNTLIIASILITSSHAEVVFTGKIQQKNAINPNTNVKYKYYALNLSRKAAVEVLDNDGELALIDNMKTIQLNFMDLKFHILSNKKAKVVCKNLYTANSMYHNEDVICMVRNINYIKPLSKPKG